MRGCCGAGVGSARHSYLIRRQVLDAAEEGESPKLRACGSVLILASLQWEHPGRQCCALFFSAVVVASSGSLPCSFGGVRIHSYDDGGAVGVAWRDERLLWRVPCRASYRF